MSYIYEPIVNRIKELKNKPIDKLGNLNQILEIEHTDWSHFLWAGCYFEFMQTDKGFSSAPDDKRTCLIVIPEHHNGCWYDIEDLNYIRIWDSYEKYQGKTLYEENVKPLDKNLVKRD